MTDEELQLAAAMSGVPIQQSILAQRMQRAQRLIGTPGAQGQQVGRVYRAASPLEHAASALARAMGYRQAGQVEKDFGALGQQAQQAGVAQLRMERGDKDRAFGLQQAGLERQVAADAASREHQAGTLGVSREQLARQQAADAAEQARYAASQGETARHNQATEGLARAAQGQDAWAAVPDPSGGVVMYNRKTGQFRPMGPQGPGLPNRGTGLKPEQFWSNVEQLGKDLEPVAKVQEDLSTLRGAVGKGNVAGFGPVAGHVPNFAVSGEAVANRQAAGRIAAGIIQMVSGQAASEKEVARLLKANGLGETATGAQIGEGVQRLANQYQTLVQQREAKYHPEVVKTYKERGGFVGPVPGAAAPTASPQAAPALRKMVGGKTYEKRADGWYEVP